jgi:hypothetical protein
MGALSKEPAIGLTLTIDPGTSNVDISAKTLTGFKASAQEWSDEFYALLTGSEPLNAAGHLHIGVDPDSLQILLVAKSAASGELSCYGNFIAHPPVQNRAIAADWYTPDCAPPTNVTNVLHWYTLGSNLDLSSVSTLEVLAVYTDVYKHGTASENGMYWNELNDAAVILGHWIVTFGSDAKGAPKIQAGTFGSSTYAVVKKAVEQVSGQQYTLQHRNFGYVPTKENPYGNHIEDDTGYDITPMDYTMPKFDRSQVPPPPSQ